MKSSNSSSSSSGGIGFLGLLTIVFIVLKLTGVIEWSWWYVTMPSWILFPILIVGFGVYLIYSLWDEGWFSKKKKT